MKSINLFNLEIAAIDSSELSKELEKYFKSNNHIKIAKINSEFLSRSLENNEFYRVLSKFNLKITDGVGVIWASKYLSLPLTKFNVFPRLILGTIARTLQAIGQMIYTGAAIIFYPKYLKNPLPETIPGLKALDIMLKEAEKSGIEVFFFGATQNDLDEAIKKIDKDYPRLKIAGSLNGYDFQENKTINPVDIINKSNAELLIVALGSPLQEFWIDREMRNLSHVKVAVGEGGSLAFLAGTIKKAPDWINNLGLEWLWRFFANRSLTHQTGSRMKRVWNAVPVFIFKTVSWKVKNG